MNFKEQLVDNVEGLSKLPVEMTLMAGAVLLLMVGLVWHHSSILKVLCASILLLALYLNLDAYFQDSLLSQSLANHFLIPQTSTLFLIASLLILIFQRTKHAQEFYFMLLSLLVGAFFLVKSNSFLVFFIALELLSLVAYILTNFAFNSKSHEAGIKYLLFGAVSSTLTLFGLALLYGDSSTIYFLDLKNFVQMGLVSKIGTGLVALGILFKVAIFPMHIWVPATYQTAPNDAIALISTVPKMAGLVFLFRFMEILQISIEHWFASLLLLLAAMTILVGTLGALRQQHVRRMISFGAIAQSGFLLPFVFLTDSTDSFFWYLTVYILMNIAVFYLLDMFEHAGLYAISDYKKYGLNYSSVIFLLVLLSLVGIPPLAGFSAKLFLFSALFNQFQLIYDGGGILLFLMIAIFSTIISLFVYLKVPYVMMAGKAKTPWTESYPIANVIATLLVILLLIAFFIPQSLTVMQLYINQSNGL